MTAPVRLPPRQRGSVPAHAPQTGVAALSTRWPDASRGIRAGCANGPRTGCPAGGTAGATASARALQLLRQALRARVAEFVVEPQRGVPRLGGPVLLPEAGQEVTEPDQPARLAPAVVVRTVQVDREPRVTQGLLDVPAEFADTLILIRPRPSR
ncbi:hypothetical protein Srubr_81900 [Streptomyces rubradiris]|uniref:Uncharacterized protein n=1 Tax=Streptomyces rubradiris TaxID=285531 RepID=A0ABQ3RR68_STRRR|nr:hypothetical protein Srubr_81900 [Streptomyces rubradiris]